MTRVLLCARAGAAELPLVARALRDRRAEPIGFDCAAFPSGTPLTLSYDGAAFGGRAIDALAGGAPVVLDEQITAIWQNLAVGLALPAMAPGVRETCVAAAELAVIGLLDGLQVFQLDPHGAQARADNKPSQLRVAQRLGLEIPATLISNDAEAVREFARRVGPVIAKMLVQPATTGPDDEDGGVMFTTAMTDEELAQLGGLDLCPMIFQPRIENRLDVRVSVVGRRVFAMALDGAARGGGDPDWRRQSYALDRAPTWTPYQLPSAIADRAGQLLDHFGLNHAALDLIVRPDGSHVFLELNASGSFAFLGEDLATPIAAAIAEVLVEPGARRGGRDG